MPNYNELVGLYAALCFVLHVTNYGSSGSPVWQNWHGDFVWAFTTIRIYNSRLNWSLLWWQLIFSLNLNHLFFLVILFHCLLGPWHTISSTWNWGRLHCCKTLLFPFFSLPLWTNLYSLLRKQTRKMNEFALPHARLKKIVSLWVRLQ